MTGMDGERRMTEGGYDGHTSDCAVHNAPALPVGPCDCGSPFLEPDDIERAGELLADPDYENCERFASRYGDTLLDVHDLALNQHRVVPDLLIAAMHARQGVPLPPSMHKRVDAAIARAAITKPGKSQCPS